MTSKLRPQYHLRQTESGIDAWRIERLIELSKNLPVRQMDPTAFAELHENHWYFHDRDLLPSPESIMEHMRLIEAVDPDYPIILDRAGRVMDGMHRICRAVLRQIPRIPAVQFTVDPEPDYTNCDPRSLPYD